MIWFVPICLAGIVVSKYAPDRLGHLHLGIELFVPFGVCQATLLSVVDLAVLVPNCSYWVLVLGLLKDNTLNQLI